MKILYILKQDLDETGEKILQEHKKMAEVTVIDLRTNKNYEEIIELIEKSDKIITW